jgi:hypothetical protein
MDIQKIKVSNLPLVLTFQDQRDKSGYERQKCSSLAYGIITGVGD